MKEFATQDRRGDEHGAPRRRRRTLQRLALAGVAVFTAAAFGQPPTRPAGDSARTFGAWEVQVASSEFDIWLTGAGAKSTRLYQRSRHTPFRLIDELGSRVASLAAVPDGVYVFFEDGRCYHYPTDGGNPSPERALPDGQRPVQVVGAADGLYGIVPTQTLLSLSPDTAEDVESPSSRPFEPGDAPLSIARYDGQRWTPVAPCPSGTRADAPARLAPRMCATKDVLYLFRRSEDGAAILCNGLDLASRRWIFSTSITRPHLAFFRAMIVNTVPTLVTAVAEPNQPERLEIYRLLPGPGEAALEWRRTKKATLGVMPEGVTVVRHDEAFTFNQQIGLVVSASDSAKYLRFARSGDEPSEPTLPVADVFSRESKFPARDALQWLSLMALLGIIAALFVFRRASLVQTLELPAGLSIALSFQRLAGWLIDTVPFAVAAALVLDIPVMESARELSGFVISVSNQLPSRDVLVWWGLTAFGHTVYCLVMELITRRTVGKMLMGVRLLSDSGGRPSWRQILVRNLSRVVELLPPLWILGFLVLISRNRQRLGDIVAGTVAVRQKSETDGSQPHDTDQRTSSDSSDSSDDAPPDADPPGG